VVERHLAKVDVEGSSPFTRSTVHAASLRSPDRGGAALSFRALAARARRDLAPPIWTCTVRKPA
jgi:hypothetical protein